MKHDRGKLQRVATSSSQQLAAITNDLKEKNNTLADRLGKPRTSIPPTDIQSAREQLKKSNDRLEKYLKGEKTGEHP